MINYINDKIDSISIVWDIDDVHRLAEDRGYPDITDEEAGEVLRNAHNNHNAEYGINWDSLEAELQEFLEDKDD